MKVFRLRQRIFLERRKRLERVLLRRLGDARVAQIDNRDVMRRKQRTELAKFSRASRRQQQRLQ